MTTELTSGSAKKLQVGACVLVEWPSHRRCKIERLASSLRPRRLSLGALRQSTRAAWGHSLSMRPADRSVLLFFHAHGANIILCKTKSALSIRHFPPG